MTIPTSPSDVWAKMYTPPPPAQPPCVDSDPDLFFFDAYAESTGVMNRKTTPRQPRNDYALQIATALRVCPSCPLATRQWCLDAVRPQHSGVCIIAGGVVFANGRPVWSLEDERRREVAA